jgi:DNA end-binding protein Ku
MPRALWKGTLGFGLVSISVELLSAEKTDELDLDLLDRRDNARIGYLKINKSTQQPVPAEEIVRGFAVSEDRYVILTSEDLKAANPKATQSIDIFGFVGDQDVPRIFLAKPYFVSPLKGSDRAYALLRDVLRKSERLALATVVIHTRQHVAAVYPHEGALVVQLLRYAADLKSPDDAGVRAVPSLSGGASSKEVAMAQQLLTSMEETWKPETYRDTYRDDVMKLVTQRSKKGSKASPGAAASPEPATKVLDLVAALQRSLASGSSSTRARAGVRHVASKSTPTALPKARGKTDSVATRATTKRGAVKKTRRRSA